MYEPKTNHFHPIEHFLIHDPKLEEIRKEILRILNEEGYDAYNQRSQKGLRYIVLRVIDGKAQCTLITGKEHIPSIIIDRIMEIPGMESLCAILEYQSVRQIRFFGSPAKVLAGSKTH